MIRVGPLPERPSTLTRRCSHPHCRTSLDEYAVECPHGLPFCEHCTWEDGCESCDLAVVA
jgi:hypothetical protein